MLPLAAARRGIGHAIDVYLLRDVEKAVALRSRTQQEQVARYADAAKRRIRAADGLVEPGDAVAALVLYREAFLFLSCAILRANSPSVLPPQTSTEAWKALEAIGFLPNARSPNAPPVGCARGSFATDDPLAIDRMTPAALREARDAAQVLLGWLSRRLEPRSQPAVRKARTIRITAAAAAGVLAALWVGSVVTSRPNIAKGKPVTVSSQRPGSPAPSGATNGEIESSYGVHTNVEDSPWVAVDLGKLFTLHEVRVYNRGDGWADEGLPLLLELSTDGQHWVVAETRMVPYSQSSPWIARLRGIPARYVRLRLPRSGYIAITEIEVSP